MQVAPGEITANPKCQILKPYLSAQVAPGEHSDEGLPASTASGGARPTGKVVGVIKRNWRTRGYCGSLQPQEERGGRGAQGVLFCPVERRFPKIRLQTRQVSIACLQLGFRV